MEPHKEQVGADKLTPQVVRLIDMVDYQQGSVVSREIIEAKAGTVTIFAFEEG